MDKTDRHIRVSSSNTLWIRTFYKYIYPTLILFVCLLPYFYRSKPSVWIGIITFVFFSTLYFAFGWNKLTALCQVDVTIDTVKILTAANKKITLQLKKCIIRRYIANIYYVENDNSRYWFISTMNGLKFEGRHQLIKSLTSKNE